MVWARHLSENLATLADVAHLSLLKTAVCEELKSCRAALVANLPHQGSEPQSLMSIAHGLACNFGTPCTHSVMKRREQSVSDSVGSS